MKLELSLSRREMIAMRLAAGQNVVAASLAIEFNVSEDAIRRDLRLLAAEGRCRRVYGGALPIPDPALPFSMRLTQDLNEKHRLARAAARTIEDGELVFIDSGSTNIALVDYLPTDRQVAVATNSIDVAFAVKTRAAHPLILVGGLVDHAIGGSVDAAAVSFLENTIIDRSFVGGCSISADYGIRVHHFGEAQFKKTLIKNSRTSIMMATSGKFHDHAPYRIGDAGDVDHVVIDETLDSSECDALERAGYRIIRAD
ncbi:DeoR/GlpR family DNA-binding transcription regulator [Rhizobium phaseoli]|uniref:DeoR/GlpR family DNA-binding transcription regulator n=1 Tax=Rhizobium phaseoli TaxID=396 RepID=UPI0014384BE8|nr:DeoR/GlpR family DNA-binding transcription regulator [Rhizobium phaseoli]MDK4728685.1 DeoR/GlpR family DNA-binding transcription regulator [Rhizobium phaseoli]NKE91093.1 DeoR/GlpR transcriptional regulator [Rhizobium phaseoli]